MKFSEKVKIKNNLGKKIFVIILICASLIFFAYIFEKYNVSKTTGDTEGAGFWGSIGKNQLANDSAAQTTGDEEKIGFWKSIGRLFTNKSAVQTAPVPTCSDGIQNQGEARVDCGGPCNACPPTCSDGEKNQDETGVDCGGTICGACPTCDDNIQNQGERGVDCGGPCSACPSCTDRIQNQGEGGVDCGGPCTIPCPATCTDGIQNQGEGGVDCGGPCNPCPQRPTITTEQMNMIKQTISTTAFVKDLPDNAIIALRFYDYFLGEQIFHPNILIAKTGIVTSGTPDMVLTIPARYISQLNGDNFCTVISTAVNNGEMTMQSEYSNAKLALKYASMLKYRDCFGI